MQLTPGKLWGMRRMADAKGRFKMVAVDQRPPIKGPIAKYHGTDEAPYDEVVRFKSLLIAELQGESSAMLLDPHFALPGGIQYLSPTRGLIITLEDSLFSDTAGGRVSAQIDDWSVEKIKRCGGDAVKVLAWYRRDADLNVRLAQQDFTRRIGDACAKYDIPFLFELLVYPLSGEADQTLDCVEMKSKKIDQVLSSVEEFAKPEYGVDVFKLESPIPANAVPGVGEEHGDIAQATFDELGRLAARPWVMLSAGASKAEFKNILTHAYKAGASGYLAGRAIWADAFKHYPDWVTITSNLRGDSIAYIQDINSLTDEQALAWHEHPVYGQHGSSFQPADHSFRHAYPGFKEQK